jgi:hypothetical protein
MDFNQLKTELNIRLGDTDNFAFTNEDKEAALTEAINDENAVAVVRDDSLTYNQTTYEYNLLATVTTVKDIYIKASPSTIDEPEKIASSLWEVVDGVLYFKPPASNTIPTGSTIFIVGHHKVTVADTVTQTNLQEFILNNAHLKCLKKLSTIKVLKFLKNDVSVAEIVAVKRELEREVAQYKARLPRSFEAA